MTSVQNKVNDKKKDVIVNSQERKKLWSKMLSFQRELNKPEISLFDRRSTELSRVPFAKALQKITGVYDKTVQGIIAKFSTTPHALSSGAPKILITITSCKRIDLLQITLNSFLVCCTDLHKINKIVLVDDHTDGDKLDIIRKQYSCIQIISNNKGGHVNSLNIIVELSKQYDYVIQLEDDFHFFEPRNYVTDCLNIFKENTMIGQVAFTMNSVEVLEKPVAGSIKHKTSGGNAYFIHRHIKETSECTIANKDRVIDEQRLLPGNLVVSLNNYYWPGFTLRPMMIRSSVYQTIGNFYRSMFFEMDYGQLFYAMGYLVAFLPTVCFEHIGKKSYEKTGANAYELNNRSQYDTAIVKNSVTPNSNKEQDTKSDSKKLVIEEIDDPVMALIIIPEDTLQSTHYDAMQSILKLRSALPSDIFVKVICTFGHSDDTLKYLFISDKSTPLSNDRIKSLIEIRKRTGFLNDIKDHKVVTVIYNGKSSIVETAPILKNVEKYGLFLSWEEILFPATFIEGKATLSSNTTPHSLISGVSSSWVIYHGVDLYGHDIKHSRSKDYILRDEAFNNKECQCYNSLGYIKRDKPGKLILLPECSLFIRL